MTQRQTIMDARHIICIFCRVPLFCSADRTTDVPLEAPAPQSQATRFAHGTSSVRLSWPDQLSLPPTSKPVQKSHRRPSPSAGTLAVLHTELRAPCKNQGVGVVTQRDSWHLCTRDHNTSLYLQCTLLRSVTAVTVSGNLQLAMPPSWQGMAVKVSRTVRKSIAVCPRALYSKARPLAL